MVEDFSYLGRDGLTLAGRDYGSGDSPLLPVVCLPGLTRTTRDFELLAAPLAARNRRVLVFDYRGRGRSGRDPTGLSYTVPTEIDDILLGMASRGVSRSVFVGTSRGGIIAMSLAAARPDLVAGAVLNDIGSVVEATGLLRIKSYVGKGAAPGDWGEAAGMLRALHGAFFPAFSDLDWQTQARLTFAEQDGKPVMDYDPLLARGLDALNDATPSADLSAVFQALVAVPVMLIRGGTSDLITRETAETMARQHPGLVTIEVPGEGHPPMLRGNLVTAIADFIDGIR
ncbi:Pimeloyl-ACP methyl ester carboxylesterase [Kaistia soli DSM 19436]|uniref:Pimeloyl-ACP methyl ester carboxylesterase n=1 Tax=Kaistia soli DSM 19436 TaxID=1122133 RepID=A0A1M5GRT0_9HYPH|nr:alpha/beta hydrolase [Kaistia soli]SHG06343.1 Pimeloyl-ACP methyl ester carboxylesterase [Kaistia soli DSM 19436]